MIEMETQLYELSKHLKKGDIKVPDIGELIPASVMLHELEGTQPIGCSYMNDWGCENLGTSADEINEMGETYYERYFVKEESASIFHGMSKYLNQGDFDKQYNFFQRVKLYRKNSYTWFYTICKLVSIKSDIGMDNKAILLSSPVSGMDQVMSRVTKVLEQDSYIQKKYRKFSELSQREKQIISLLANGKSTKKIAEELYISSHTVSTHRKNIIRKIECNSFAELIRFAIAFDLI